MTVNNSVLIVDNQRTFIIDGSVEVVVPDDLDIDVTELCYHAVLQKIANSGHEQLKLKPDTKYVVKAVLVVTEVPPNGVEESDIT